MFNVHCYADRSRAKNSVVSKYILRQGEKNFFYPAHPISINYRTHAVRGRNRELGGRKIDGSSIPVINSIPPPRELNIHDLLFALPIAGNPPCVCASLPFISGANHSLTSPSSPSGRRRHRRPPPLPPPPPRLEVGASCPPPRLKVGAVCVCSR